MRNIYNNNQYEKLVDGISPKPKLLRNCFRAFWTGGLICIIGQVIHNILMNAGVGNNNAVIYTSIILIFMGALLTGLDIYGRLGQYSGAGTIIPITGFANSIVASAIEYKKEGYVLGVGAKMFTIAGPVIVYGVITSVIVGLIYYIFTVVLV